MTARHVLEDTKGLTGGHWEQGSGGLAHWVADSPSPRGRRDQRTRPCQGGCGARVRPGVRLCHVCRDQVVHLRPLTAPGREVCACGCLLAGSDARCPACLVELTAS